MILLHRPRRTPLSRHRDENRVTTSPLDSALTKSAGCHLLVPSKILSFSRALPSPATRFAHSFHSLHQECFTTLFQSDGSALFLKIAGCVPPRLPSFRFFFAHPPASLSHSLLGH